ncbi:MAG: hypothetical protein ACE37H_14335 [Phycisphaeraceae bacterium]
MKHLHRCLALVLSLCLAPALYAQDDAPDDIDVRTPTNPVELLPEGGIDKADLDFWLVMETKGEGFGQDMYIHWSIKPVDGKLVVQMRQGSADDGDGAFSMNKRIVYSAKGKLESFESGMSFGSFGGQTAAGKVQGDTLVITTQQQSNFDLPDDVEIEPDLDQGPKTRRVPLKDVEATLTPELMPLAFGYHARNGSLSYRFPMDDLANEMGEGGSMKVEDLGQEPVTFAGQEHTAHLLSVKMVQKVGLGEEDFEQTMRMLVLKDGTIMKMFAGEDGIEMNAQRKTFAEVKEKFNLNDDGSPKAKQADDEDAEDAGDAVDAVEAVEDTVAE